MIPSIIHAFWTPHLEVIDHDLDDIETKEQEKEKVEDEKKKDKVEEEKVEEAKEEGKEGKEKVEEKEKEKVEDKREEMVEKKEEKIESKKTPEEVGDEKNELDILGIRSETKNGDQIESEETSLSMLPEPEEAVEDVVDDGKTLAESENLAASIPATAVKQVRVPTEELKQAELSTRPLRRLSLKQQLLKAALKPDARRHHLPYVDADGYVDERLRHPPPSYVNSLQHFVQLPEHLTDGGGNVPLINYLVDYPVEEVPLPELHSLTGFETDYPHFTPDPRAGLTDLDYPEEIATFHSPHGFQRALPVEQTGSTATGVGGGGRGGGVGGAGGEGGENGFDIALPNYVHPDFSLPVGEPKEPGVDYTNYYPFINKNQQPFFTGSLRGMSEIDVHVNK